ncbi:hypothetical protein ACJX0J_006095, partial [Zea mays]
MFIIAFFVFINNLRGHAPIVVYVMFTIFLYHLGPFIVDEKGSQSTTYFVGTTNEDGYIITIRFAFRQNCLLKLGRKTALNRFLNEIMSFFLRGMQDTYIIISPIYNLWLSKYPVTCISISFDWICTHYFAPDMEEHKD